MSSSMLPVCTAPYLLLEAALQLSAHVKRGFLFLELGHIQTNWSRLIAFGDRDTFSYFSFEACGRARNRSAS